jgi:phenylalanine-specific permease
MSPITNYLCLGYFVLIYILMTQDPASHAGAIALPLWFCGLLIVGFLLNRVRR